MPFVFLVFAFTIAALALVAGGLWHHKKSARRQLNPIGATGTIESTLDPEGAVIIDGELWRARTELGNTLKVRNRVRVVGVQAHLLLVAPMSPMSDES